MKLCIFAGTFNPIHNAHLAMAQYVLDNFEFDKILFIPAYKPPHKDYDDSMSFHRLEMVKLATQNNPKFEVSDIEFKREGKSYTYLTVLEIYKNMQNTSLRAELSGAWQSDNSCGTYATESLHRSALPLPLTKERLLNYCYEILRLSVILSRAKNLITFQPQNDCECNSEATEPLTRKVFQDFDNKLSFIIGTDAFKKIETWYETDKLKKLVDFIVFIRENEAVNLDYLKDKGYNFQFAQMNFIDISSTELRERIYNKKSIKNLVPKEIEEYINKNGLYRDKELA